MVRLLRHFFFLLFSVFFLFCLSHSCLLHLLDYSLLFFCSSYLIWGGFRLHSPYMVIMRLSANESFIPLFPTRSSVWSRLSHRLCFLYADLFRMVKVGLLCQRSFVVFLGSSVSPPSTVNLGRHSTPRQTDSLINSFFGVDWLIWFRPYRRCVYPMVLFYWTERGSGVVRLLPKIWIRRVTQVTTSKCWVRTVLMFLSSRWWSEIWGEKVEGRFSHWDKTAAGQEQTPRVHKRHAGQS